MIIKKEEFQKASKLGIISLVLIFLVYPIFINCGSKNIETMTVIQKGLKVKKEKDMKSETLTILPPGMKIKVSVDGEKVRVDKKEDYWYKLADMKGYVFGSFITNNKDYKNKDVLILYKTDFDGGMESLDSVSYLALHGNTAILNNENPLGEYQQGRIAIKSGEYSYIDNKLIIHLLKKNEETENFKSDEGCGLNFSNYACREYTLTEEAIDEKIELVYLEKSNSFIDIESKKEVEKPNMLMNKKVCAFQIDSSKIPKATSPEREYEQERELSVLIGSYCESNYSVKKIISFNRETRDAFNRRAKELLP